MARQEGPSADAGVRPGGERTWQVFLVGGLLLTIVYVAAPYGTYASAVYVVATFVAAAGIVLAMYRRTSTYCPEAWLLVALALGLAGVGHAIWYWLDLHGLEPFPSAADVFYLAVYPLFMVALWMLGRGDRDDGALVDSLIVGVSAVVMGWGLLIAPYLQDPDLTIGQLLVSTAYPVADLVVLPLVLRLLFLYRTRAIAHQFLLLAMLAYLVADILYAHGNSAGWYVPGGFTDGWWLVAYALFVAAAWHPSASTAPELRSKGADLTRRRILVLGAASVLVPAAILLSAGTDVHTVRVAAIGSILLFLLVMYRMARLMKRTERQAEMLEELSRTDPLTGVANRRHLEHELARELSRARRTGTTVTLAFLDLDHFKRYNDTHGHAAGDRLLQELVTAWNDVLRPTDLLARVGGEEFVLVLPDADAGQARGVVERLRSLVPQGETCSAGLAVYRSGEEPAVLLERADSALYVAKHGGRNRAVFDDA